MSRVSNIASIAIFAAAVSGVTLAIAAPTATALLNARERQETASTRSITLETRLEGEPHLRAVLAEIVQQQQGSTDTINALSDPQAIETLQRRLRDAAASVEGEITSMRSQPHMSKGETRTYRLDFVIRVPPEKTVELLAALEEGSPGLSIEQLLVNAALANSGFIDISGTVQAVGVIQEAKR